MEEIKDDVIAINEEEEVAYIIQYIKDVYNLEIDEEHIKMMLDAQFAYFEKIGLIDYPEAD